MGILRNCNFINNTGYRGGAVYWRGAYGKITASSFTDNIANMYGGGIYWYSGNGVLSDSNFINNVAKGNGGGVCWAGDSSTLTSCTFTGNIARCGGAIIVNAPTSMVNCSFINSKALNDKNNGIMVWYSSYLNFIGGSGIVDILNEGTISGISIVVLNNETYYYPANTNINLHDKNYKKI